MKVLDVKNVSKCYKIFDKPHKHVLASLFPSLKLASEEFWALQDINFQLNKGETLGIVGRNGAGKSTLLQIICGTLAQTTGVIKSNGRVAALLELGAGFDSDYTGRENIYLNAAIYGLSRSEVDRRMERILNFAGIGDFIDRPVKTYSSGMFVRLAFSIIVHVDADILIIDEALAVGDALFSQKCMRFLEEFKEHGTVVFVSHDSGAVTQLCDRSIWLHDGRIRLFGSAKEVTEAYLEFLYAEQQGNIYQEVPDTNNKEIKSSEGEKCDQVAVSMDEWHDPRREFINGTNLRNDIEIFKFDTSSKFFGTGKISVLDTCFKDDEGRRLSWVMGGASVWLEVTLLAHEDIENFIVGFLIKNRLGQVLFGENNLLFDKLGESVEKGKKYTAKLKFVMPYLSIGEYVLSLGIASGTQKNHVQHCWIHDAIVFTCHSSHVIHGLFGVPSLEFKLLECLQE